MGSYVINTNDLTLAMNPDNEITVDAHSPVILNRPDSLGSIELTDNNDWIFSAGEALDEETRREIQRLRELNPVSWPQDHNDPVNRFENARSYLEIEKALNS